MMRKRRNRRGERPSAEPPVPVKGKAKISELFDIPQAALPGLAQIEMSGNQEAIVDGIQGVLEYDENIIKLACGKMSIRFCGRGLQIKVLTHDSAIIGGFITSVEFLT